MSKFEYSSKTKINYDKNDNEKASSRLCGTD